MPPLQAAGWVLILASLFTSCGSLGERKFRSGIAAYGKGDLNGAIHDLWSFVATDCHYPQKLDDMRCREAELDLARAFRRSQHPAWSLLIYDKMQLWQSAMEVAALKGETDETKAALETTLARSPMTVPAEIRFRHDALNSFEVTYALLYLDGKKVFDSREHAVPVDLTAGWVTLFSGSLPDGEHAVVFKIASVSRPAKATPSPMLWTRSRVVGGKGKPILLDLISLMRPGTLMDYGEMHVAVGIHTPISPEEQEAEELDDPMVVPED